MCLGKSRLACEIESADLDASGMRCQHACQHLQSCAFACAILSEESEYFTTVQLHRYTVDYALFAETANQAMCGQGKRGVRHVFDSSGCDNTPI